MAVSIPSRAALQEALDWESLEVSDYRRAIMVAYLRGKLMTYPEWQEKFIKDNELEQKEQG